MIKLNEFYREIKVGKRLINVKIEIGYEHDDACSIDDLDHPEDIKAAKEGRITANLGIVRAKFAGFEGDDYLGGIWASSEEYILSSIESNQMVEEACNDLIDKMIEAHDVLYSIFED